MGFPAGSVGKESTCNVGDLRLIPGLGRPTGGGHGSPLQYSCLENPHGQRSLAGCSPLGKKDLDVTKNSTALLLCSVMNLSSVQFSSVTQSCLTLCDPMAYSPWNSPGQNTGVGSLSLLQGIFPTQGSNAGLPHYRWILYQLSHKGSPKTEVIMSN